MEHSTINNEKFAVIDLGTNTFHLIIVQKITSGTFKELYRKRVFVKLAEDGIQKIGPLPFERGVNAILLFKKEIDKYQVTSIRAFGTAALRTASNGSDFIRTLQADAGISIQLIPGDREAELIYKGIIQAIPLNEQPVVIMDIGGGSVEFIIANNQGVKWAQSFPVGVAVLYNNFHKEDPISKTEMEVLISFLDQQLSPLIAQLKNYNPTTLIGASGTFDVLENTLCPAKLTEIHGIVKVKDFHPFFEKLLKSNLQQRFDMSEIPDSRAEMIIVALILIDFILKKSTISTISVSSYAMKEGMLKEMMEEN